MWYLPLRDKNGCCTHEGSYVRQTYQDKVTKCDRCGLLTETKYPSWMDPLGRV